jgi:hypothetical protein
MRSVPRYCGILLILAFCVIALPAQNPPSADDKKIIRDFEKRAKTYVDLREKLRRRLPKLSEDATAEQIQAQKTALQKAVQAARVNARQGSVFTQSATALIRSTIKSEFKGYERAELRQTVLEADTKGVPLKINFPYPESKELVEMSPALLLSLPQLPKQLRFRYIGRSLVILDRDNSLIVDFMKDALP